MDDGGRVGWRFWLGCLVFVGSWMSPLLIPAVLASPLPPAWRTLLAGLLALGIPEVGSVVAVAIMGQSGYAVLKKWVGSLLGRLWPAERVSPTRYRLGLVLFLVPVLASWATPYALYAFPSLLGSLLPVAVAGDVLFVVSLFVLGGEFWDKVRALFVYEARVAILSREVEPSS